MVEVKGSNITCALGLTTAQAYNAVSRGQCGITPHTGRELGVTDDYMASVVDTSLIPAYGTVPMTRLEQMAIHSITDAAKSCDVDLTSDRTLFILSSTKGNIELLDDQHDLIDKTRVYLPETARFIAEHFGNPAVPIVVSNACISGLSALILAKRLIDNGKYDNVVVTGVDTVSKFTVSGFQSFKALSSGRCKPFDATRDGLNLGEAAATIILSKADGTIPGAWYIEAGAMHNDANHISGPSRVGEGSYRCLRAVTKDIDINDIAVINPHGTATLYNDEMESIALDRAGLASVKVNAYKGYLGHTLGAAGVLECILSMQGIDNGIVLKTLGYESIGVSRPLNIVTENTATDRRMFVKMLSGFGGSNAAVRLRKEGRK